MCQPGGGNKNKMSRPPIQASKVRRTSKILLHHDEHDAIYLQLFLVVSNG